MDTRSTLFSIEFDAYVHKACLESAALDGDHRAHDLNWEFGLGFDSSPDEGLIFDLTGHFSR